ncbi:MAG: alginate lyase family protein [Desulfobulbaceae bacterium]|nr:alginate lyase family protein [Desulfobulbaceae bacterium]
MVDLLGSGSIELGAEIDWHKDYKSGFSWPPAYIRSIEYNNPERPSDVKFPWEVSRMQWLIPVGQAYLLTGDERYALKARDVLTSWIDNNLCAYSVNWACTMEVALRIFSWTWFFHVFHQSRAWNEVNFQAIFLTALYLHGDFTERHLERSDINGNHYTADAAGLVFAGLFFGSGEGPARWQNLGWQILSDELPRQVYPDGVDFEASVPYHRLVLELFTLPALLRQGNGDDVPGSYRERLLAMAKFTASYSRPDGTVPLWGDADDARVLPFGSQPINDHRYLLGWLGKALGSDGLLEFFSGSLSEVYWLLGPEMVTSLPQRQRAEKQPPSIFFPDGGFCVMQNGLDHVFIDCGPVGLGGRGGHGHNDCLSFEACLDGVPLISDCGAYLYTASYNERNSFRSTAYHNTPQVDKEEINRFIRPDYLWNLHDDARPEVKSFKADSMVDLFVGTHSGYQRLSFPVKPLRTVTLVHHQHMLIIHDTFEGEGEHLIEIPYHTVPGLAICRIESNVLRLQAGDKQFQMIWDGDEEWQVEVDDWRVSPSYGVVCDSKRITFRRAGSLSPLLVCIAPEQFSPMESLRSAIEHWEKASGQRW